MAIIGFRSELSTDESILISIVRTAELIKRVQSSVFRNYGLSFPQYNVLRVLDASKGGRDKISDVSRTMLVPGANITGLAKRLEVGGFIHRKSDPSDERVTILEITDKGRKALKTIEREKDDATAYLLKKLSETEKEDILEKVERLLDTE